MKLRIIFINAFIILTVALIGFSCQKQSASDSNTPTGAFKNLYAAVKAKDSAKIKQMMSKSSLGMADFLANQQKKTVDQILENGFTATTFAPSLPEIRDERVKDNFGAIEVRNEKENRWEDLPFVLEDGTWKLAVGDLFQDTYKSPGKSKAEIENEANNKLENIPLEQPNMNGAPGNGIPQMPNGAKVPPVMPSNSSNQVPPIMPSNDTKSVEVTPEKKPKK